MGVLTSMNSHKRVVKALACFCMLVVLVFVNKLEVKAGGTSKSGFSITSSLSAQVGDDERSISVDNSPYPYVSKPASTHNATDVMFVLSKKCDDEDSYSNSGSATAVLAGGKYAMWYVVSSCYNSSDTKHYNGDDEVGKNGVDHIWNEDGSDGCEKKTITSNVIASGWVKIDGSVVINNNSQSVSPHKNCHNYVATTTELSQGTHTVSAYGKVVNKHDSQELCGFWVRGFKPVQPYYVAYKDYCVFNENGSTSTNHEQLGTTDKYVVSYGVSDISVSGANPNANNTGNKGIKDVYCGCDVGLKAIPTTEYMDNGETQKAKDTTPNKYYTGYYFLGHGSGCTSATVSANQEITVTRKFMPIEYTVNLHKNKPSCASHDVQYTETPGYTNNGEYVTRLYYYEHTRLPLSNNEIFYLVGWHTDDENKWYSEGYHDCHTDEWVENGGVGEQFSDVGYSKSYTAGDESKLTTVHKSTLDLYPKWVPNKFTIKYDKNESNVNSYGDQVTSFATGTVPDTACYYDHDIFLETGESFNKIGYYVKSWNTKPDGSGIEFQPGEHLVRPQTQYPDLFPETDGGSMTLYAIWEPIRYDVTYLPNKGTTHTGAGDYDSDYRMASYTEKYGEQVRYDQWFYLSPNEYIRKYWVEIRNAEPWLYSLESQNGNRNSASKWVEYTFLGWTQDQTYDSEPYYVIWDVYNNDKSIYNKLKTGTRQFINPGNMLASSERVLLADRERVRNLTYIQDGVVELNAAWKSAVMKLPRAVSGEDDFHFIDWSDKSYVDERLYDKEIHDNTDGYIPVSKETNYQPFQDTELFGHWYKDVELTLNLQGGTDLIVSEPVVLSGTFYDYRKGYTFNISGGQTKQKKGEWDDQLSSVWISDNYINGMNIYGIVDTSTLEGLNGINSEITKVDDNGQIYRLLGWNHEAVVVEPAPEERFNVFNNSKLGTYNILDNETLYAQWERVLHVNVGLYRSLGELKFADGSSPLNNTGSLMATYTPPTIYTIIKAGEQGNYKLDIFGRNDIDLKVLFDSKITDIYDHGDSSDTWYDELNIVDDVSELLEAGQKHGMNKHIVGPDNSVMRKFYMPQYIGTSKSYETSKDEGVFDVEFNLEQYSFYYSYVYDTTEKIKVNGLIFISDNYTPDGDTGSDPVGGSSLDTISSEFRTRIRK